MEYKDVALGTDPSADQPEPAPGRIHSNPLLRWQPAASWDQGCQDGASSSDCSLTSPATAAPHWAQSELSRMALGGLRGSIPADGCPQATLELPPCPVPSCAQGTCSQPLCTAREESSAPSGPGAEKGGGEELEQFKSHWEAAGLVSRHLASGPSTPLGTALQSLTWPLGSLEGEAGMGEVGQSLELG